MYWKTMSLHAAVPRHFGENPTTGLFLPRGYTAEVLEKINDTKKRILPPIINFTDKFKGRKTVREISEAFTNLFASRARKEKYSKKLIITGKTDKSKKSSFFGLERPDVNA